MRELTLLHSGIKHRVDQYYLVKGNLDAPNCNEISCNTTLADESEVHAVRCCSDTKISGWQKNKACSVWADSDIWGECKELNWQEANTFCTSQGGRLCSKEELEANCAAGTGCSFDYRLVWSSTCKFIRYMKVFKQEICLVTFPIQNCNRTT